MTIDYLLNLASKSRAVVRVCGLLAVTSLLFAGCTTSTPTSDNSLPPLPENNEAATQELIDLINETRANGYECFSGVFDPTDALTEDERLEQAALKHSHDMETNDFFAHQSPNDRTNVEDRVEKAGYTSWQKVGENLARFSSQVEPSAVLGLWLESNQRHCSALMDPAFTEIGVGVVDFEGSPYWTAVFARPQ